MERRLIVRGGIYILLAVLFLYFPAPMTLVAAGAVAAVLVRLLSLRRSKKKVLRLYLKLNLKHSLLLLIQYAVIILVLLQLQYTSVQTTRYFDEQYAQDYFPYGHMLLERTVVSGPGGISFPSFGDLKLLMPDELVIQLPEAEGRFGLQHSYRHIYYLTATVSWNFKEPYVMDHINEEVWSASDSFSIVVLTPYVTDLLGEAVDEGETAYAFGYNRTNGGAFDHFQLGNIDSNKVYLNSSNPLTNSKDLVANITVLDPEGHEVLIDLLSQVGIGMTRVLFISMDYLQTVLKPSPTSVGDYFTGVFAAVQMYFSTEQSMFELMDSGLVDAVTTDLSSQGYRIVLNDVQRIYSLQDELLTRFNDLMSYLTWTVYLVLGLSFLSHWKAYVSRRREIVDFYRTDRYDISPIEDMADLYEQYLVHVLSILLMLLLGLTSGDPVQRIADMLHHYFLYVGSVSILLAFGDDARSAKFRTRVDRPLSNVQFLLGVAVALTIFQNMFIGQEIERYIQFVDSRVFITLQPVLLILFLVITVADLGRGVMAALTNSIRQSPWLRVRKVNVPLKYLIHQSMRMGPVLLSVAVASLILSLMVFTSSVKQIHMDEVRGDLGGDITVNFHSSLPLDIQAMKTNLSRLPNIRSDLTISITKISEYQLGDSYSKDIEVQLIGYNLTELHSFPTPGWTMREEVVSLEQDDIIFLHNSKYVKEISSEGVLTVRGLSQFGKNFFEKELGSVRTLETDPEDLWGSYWVTGQLDGYNNTSTEQRDVLTAVVSMEFLNQVLGFKSSRSTTTVLGLRLGDTDRVESTAKVLKEELGHGSDVTVLRVPSPESLDKTHSYLYPVLQTQMLLTTSVVPIWLLSLYLLYSFARDEEKMLRENSLQNQRVRKLTVAGGMFITAMNYFVLSQVLLTITATSFNNAYRVIMFSSTGTPVQDISTLLVGYLGTVVTALVTVIWGFTKSTREEWQ